MRFKTSNIKEATHTGMIVEQITCSPKSYRLFNKLTVILQIRKDGKGNLNLCLTADHK